MSGRRTFVSERKAREDEASATKRMNEMIANYGDVIPRRDYEQLQKHYQVSEDCCLPDTTIIGNYSYTRC